MRLPLNWLLLVALTFGPLVATNASMHAARTAPHPPQPLSPESSADFTISDVGILTLELPQLKAVLVVGPIDGDQGAWTTKEKQNMDLAAAELAANGVQVHTFYAPHNDWAQITTAAAGAHFFLYRGHGVFWTDFPSPTVGGLALRDRFISSEDIRNALHLAPNAIVMLYGCFTAGSSSADHGPIGSAEAQRRVAQYSDPFFDNGIAGYYANWYGDAFQMFVRYLFDGKTLGEAYEAYFDYNGATVERYLHPEHPDMAMWLDKDYWEYTQYNNAFVGLSDVTLGDLYAPAVLSLTPAAITHLAEPSHPALSYPLQVDINALDAITWTASVAPEASSWLSVQPASGLGGQHLTAIVTPTNKNVGSYEAFIQVVAENLPSETREQSVPVELHIVQQVHRLYFPLAQYKDQ